MNAENYWDIRLRMQLRPHGPSIVVTLTKQVLDVTGFELGDTMAIDAEPGQIVIQPVGPRKHDSGVFIKSLRSHGNSVVITLPPDALKVAGFENRDLMVVEARKGEVRLTEVGA